MFSGLTLIGFLVGFVEDSNLRLHEQVATALNTALKDSGRKINAVAVFAQIERRSPASLDGPDRITRLRKLLENLLKSSGRDLVDDAEFENAVRKLNITAPIRPTDVTRIRRFTAVDGILTSTWSLRNNKQIVRLVLVAPDGVLWTQTLTAPIDDELEVPETKESSADAGNHITRTANDPSDIVEAARILGIAGSGGFMTRQDTSTARQPSSSKNSPLEGANAAQATLEKSKTPNSQRDGLAGKDPGNPGKTGVSDRGSRNEGAIEPVAISKPARTDAPSSGEQSSRASKSPASRDERSIGTDSLATSTRPATRTATAVAIVPEVNRKVLEFASNNLGRQVGNGECWTLAAEALSYAEAQPPRGYSFGRELATSEQPLPGDIMQFTTCRFQDRNFTAVMGLPNHTAIVYAVDGDKITFIHQNFGNRMVTLLSLDMSTRVGGNYSTYRPLPKDSR